MVLWFPRDAHQTKAQWSCEKTDFHTPAGSFKMDIEQTESAFFLLELLNMLLEIPEIMTRPCYKEQSFCEFVIWQPVFHLSR